MEFQDLLPVLIPLVILEIAIRIYAIVDIHKEERKTILLGKTAWTVLVALVNFAWVVYFIGGRGYDAPQD